MNGTCRDKRGDTRHAL